MIVFDLKCGQAHVFEAWFGSSSDYDSQRSRGLLSCPLCGDIGIEKAVMAPNIPAKGNRQTGPLPSGVAMETAKAMLTELVKAQAKVLEPSQWVGRDFADRARAMHDGEEANVAIHGEATIVEARRLIEDGVTVNLLPFPVVPPGQRH